ncbi:MAG: helix-turn-helix domain-containing protein [Candidatus Sumerlaeia bacterium]|nr:helix-turn-helix domain-containing protein [Candidatus Sumerlaeia bacterium]
MSERLLTVEEIAQFLHVSEVTVYRLLRRGEIPAYKVAGQWRFNKSVINRWLAKGAKGQDADIA